VNVINASTGAAVTSANTISATANWTPIDTRDPVTLVTATCPSCPNSISDKSIATQKSAQNTTDASNSPGDVITYTVDFQVSDYFTFGSIVITDTLGDGLRLTGTPTITVTDRDGIVNGNFTSGTNLTVDTSRFPAAYGGTGVCGDGTTVLTFNISQAMTANGAANGIITGGQVNGGAFGAATGQIKFGAIIQQEFACDFPSGDRSVDHGDTLPNTVTISGEVLDNPTQTSQTPTQTTTDGSSASITIAFGALTKSVYAINGTCAIPARHKLAPTASTRATP
jgi:fimbrial isopeptide formation D2 family protein